MRDYIKGTRAVEKKIWSIGYRGEDSKPANVEIIAPSFEVVNNWIMRHVWSNTVTYVAIKQTIQEIGE